ncbi:hypothetical protein K432DRAFT_388293 [Lepidopterella palustris CBS 459.81]|uniref:Uncharacterized protein n=1 Tax=Lepidopterella palustris CBS 459.81 TaxID=1314670 RepID=A0A8E2JKX6_9PEZI|nr:hypothetical protein K432DRAFT_388293 [Lepidopterella palustris CBS 459.81]
MNGGTVPMLVEQKLQEEHEEESSASDSDEYDTAAAEIPSYDFPGTWTDAYNSTAKATKNVVVATSSFAGAMASSGIGKAGTAVTRAALMSSAKIISKTTEVMGPPVEDKLYGFKKRIFGDKHGSAGRRRQTEREEQERRARRRRGPPEPQDMPIAMVYFDASRLPHFEHARTLRYEESALSPLKILDSDITSNKYEQRGRSRTSRSRKPVGRQPSRVDQAKRLGHFTISGSDTEGDEDNEYDFVPRCLGELTSMKGRTAVSNIEERNNAVKGNDGLSGVPSTLIRAAEFYPPRHTVESSPYIDSMVVSPDLAEAVEEDDLDMGYFMFDKDQH